ncbi:MAG TPA: transglycosylase domain-containing protein [Acidimicrobiales bacterium]
MKRKRTPHPADLKPNGKRKSIFWRWRRAFFLLGLLFVAGIAGVGYVVANVQLPPERIQAQTSFICGADVTGACTADNAIASLHGEQDRQNVTLDQVPQVMVDAVLAAEDRGFFNHPGVDPVGTLRALWADIRNKGSEQGGSTITQQYVKTVYLSSERTLSRKLKEAVLSIKVEQQFTKQQILERYLNVVYFGRGAYGIGAAVRTYFGHDLSQVTLPEAAYLAGLIRSPETADGAIPAQVKEAEFRRHSVLQGMLDMKRITSDQMQQADAVPFTVLSFDNPNGTILARRDSQGVDYLRGADVGSQYFVEYVKQQLNQHGFSDAEIFGGGLRIYTTLDLGMQAKAWDAVTSTLDNPDDPAASLVSLDPNNQIKAMIGGRDFANDKVNLAVPGGGGSGRQAGSSFKPYVLSAAVQQGISLNSLFNAPSEIVIPKANGGADWHVHNAEPSSGVLNLIDATKVSSNTVFAQLMAKVKPENVVPLAEQMGITTQLPVVDSLVLGGGEVFPLDMASGYSTWAHRGVHITPTAIVKVVRPDGTVVSFDQPQAQVLTQPQSDLVTFAMQGVVHGGTGNGAYFGKPLAGKTGTTEDNKDAWFVGFTPNGYTTAVWMGYETPKPMTNVHGRVVFGGTFPATMFNKYMSAITDGMDVGNFVNPKSFPGKVLNSDLTTTSSTDTTVPGSSSTTVPVPTVPATTAAPTTAPAATEPPTTAAANGPGP